MRIRVEIADDISEKEIIIKTPFYDKQTEDISELLSSFDKKMQLAFYRQGREYYLSVDDFLFFETEGRQVYAHTVDRIYVTKYRLYELEKILTSNFVRASKSAILNVDKVWSLTHSLSNNLIEFNGSQKQIYVSRRYYHAVKEKLEGRGIEHE